MGAPDTSYVEDAACYALQGLLANPWYLSERSLKIPDAVKRTKEIVDDAFYIASMMEEKRRRVEEEVSRPVKAASR